MPLSRKAMLVVIALPAIAAAAGCGSGGGAGDVVSREDATLVVTRDFGSRTVVSSGRSPITPGLTAMRQLQRHAGTETSYGGRYVTAIGGLKQDLGAGRDWLFYVDGLQASKGAAAWRIKPGQAVQWDYHRWRDVRSGGAIVGAFPRPLNSAGVDLRCAPSRSRQCDIARNALSRAGARVNGEVTPRMVRVIVGEWSEIAALKGVPDLTKPAAANGAFARVAGPRSLALSGDDGSVRERLGAGSGLIAAFDVHGTVTWLITGVDARGAEAAALSLNLATLKNRFAVAVSDGREIGLPLTGAGGRR